ncbi:nitroreductase family deazaflavin-dependent oxidoreductase [Streptomyces sp. A7024]|uniref:Nitroreductase family deazaflavin-dependent oxidoreductase n=1 Tax=Streptomyces coryli TaxID=1128680 RepID=A0A6G4U667_9ACTN|nr:nitroreductase family deazaflavin-dependent oxidoreductase [Streptomyces coryli]NGN67735.1 nitroreductase family deazaflavin-dependent oxidoreductase [Streptomyces coryli]
MSEQPNDNQPFYMKPTEAERKNRIHRSIGWLAAHGLPVNGKRILAIRGRKSGEWRTQVVNPLRYKGERYLVAPRGHTQWVRNLRAAGEGELRLGPRTQRFTAVELDDTTKPALLRAYLKRWGMEVGDYFAEVNAKSPESELIRISERHPIFRITTVK